MTVSEVFHRLWSSSERSRLDARDEKRLWMLLQNFIEQSGGLQALAEDFDRKHPSRRLEEIKPVRSLAGKLKQFCKSLIED